MRRSDTDSCARRVLWGRTWTLRAPWLASLAEGGNFRFKDRACLKRISIRAKERHLFSDFNSSEHTQQTHMQYIHAYSIRPHTKEKNHE